MLLNRCRGTLVKFGAGRGGVVADDRRAASSETLTPTSAAAFDRPALDVVKADLAASQCRRGWMKITCSERTLLQQRSIRAGATPCPALRSAALDCRLAGQAVKFLDLAASMWVK